MKRSSKSKHHFKSKRRPEGPIRPAASMPVINPHAAGIDVGQTEHYGSVRPDAEPPGEELFRCFGPFPQSLTQWLEWWLRRGTKTGAMTGTGGDGLRLEER